MPSDAAKEHSGTFKELEQKRFKIKRQIRYHINEHKRIDDNDMYENHVAVATLSFQQFLARISQNLLPIVERLFFTDNSC